MGLVLFLTHVGDPGGAEYKMLDLAASLPDDCEVLYFQNGSLKQKLDAKGIKSSQLKMNKILTDIKRTDSFFKLLSVFPEVIKLMWRLSQHVGQYNTLVCMSQKSFLLASLIKPFNRKPIIWFMNDILSDEHFSKAMIKILIFVSFFSADYIVLNSKASYEAWIAAGGRKKNIKIIYPGTDFDFFEKRLNNAQKINEYKRSLNPKNKPLIGIFGRITAWKGQDIFIQAISLISEAKAIVVGEPFFGEHAYEQQIHQLVKKLNLEDKITFTGHTDDVPEIMAACDVVVHCSTAPEPFGLVIVEAMAARRPVIASDAGGAQEIIHHNITGQLTPMGDAILLADAIKKYIADPAWALNISNEAYANSKETFSTNKMIEQFKIILGQLDSSKKKVRK